MEHPSHRPPAQGHAAAFARPASHGSDAPASRALDQLAPPEPRAPQQSAHESRADIDALAAQLAARPAQDRQDARALPRPRPLPEPEPEVGRCAALAAT